MCSKDRERQADDGEHSVGKQVDGRAGGRVADVQRPGQQVCGLAGAAGEADASTMTVSKRRSLWRSNT